MWISDLPSLLVCLLLLIGGLVVLVSSGKNNKGDDHDDHDEHDDHDDRKIGKKYEHLAMNLLSEMKKEHEQEKIDLWNLIDEDLHCRAMRDFFR